MVEEEVGDGGNLYNEEVHRGIWSGDMGAKALEEGVSSTTRKAKNMVEGARRGSLPSYKGDNRFQAVEEGRMEDGGMVVEGNLRLPVSLGSFLFEMILKEARSFQFSISNLKGFHGLPAIHIFLSEIWLRCLHLSMHSIVRLLKLLPQWLPKPALQVGHP
jgi:hypothetical protein